MLIQYKMKGSGKWESKEIGDWSLRLWSLEIVEDGWRRVSSSTTKV